MTPVAIGLGSNVGDRGRNLAQAADLLQMHPEFRITAYSPLYETPALLPENAPDAWNTPFFNQVILAETTLSPETLLNHLKQCEAQLGRQVRGHWGPREVDCDLLLYGNRILQTDSLQIPHPHMTGRTFVMVPLEAVAPEWEVPGKGQVHALCAALPRTEITVVPLPRPQWMGIVNLTPDSFSDGGRCSTIETALAQIQSMVAAGVDIIDVGAESTRPGAIPISAEAEWARLSPVLQALPKTRAWRLSVDTYHPQTAERAVMHGANWINDISGLRDPAMLAVLRDADVSIVAMHAFSIPADPGITLPENHDPVAAVAGWAQTLLARTGAEGIAPERIILDPGIGFGKTKQQSLALIHRFRDLKETLPQQRWLVGHSRKSYQTLFGDIPVSERDAQTLVHSCVLARQGVDILRIHDVGGHIAYWEGQ